ncbi:probable serine/threonine-protein kinase DDB_G0280133 isoform X1 [Colias croceus]|uniref:probable serine/threonine-protein kinase DDB_G0280133 isoform X1 n=1 Tax=Colias crocea TaxID=72248 RepID=UPI001E27AF50|nr:probable serine/threonine-protein kinase DDB_G0280133 isoform X1 [Colias croceus]
MKSKRRHHDSSDESEESDVSDKSSSSSDSESDVSSVSDHRHKKKKKRADSSESESDSDDQKRAKKRKHKKKKRKHSKKKRRSESEQHESDDNISISEGEISVKKKRKHKHKHSKRGHGSSEEEEHVSVERRLHSVVKERRADSEEHRPSRTYYQKEYPHSGGNEYDRESEVERFYRGSSKDRRQHYQDNYYPDPERGERYPPQQDRFDRNRDKYGQSSQYNEYNQRPREYEQYKRNQRYDDQRPDDGYQKRRNEPYVRDDPRGNKYKQYGERGPMRKEFPDEREYHQRRGPPEPPLREREYPEKRERFPEETRSSDRSRDVRRERLGRPEKPIAQEREYSRSPEERYKEKRRVEHKGERGEPDRDRDSYREREDRRREYSRDRHRSNNDARADRGPRERKSRFADTDEKKDYSWGKTEVKKEGSQTGEKEKPNFGLSGKLTADANTVNGVVIKYTEPDDAKQPKRRWRFYPFKGDKALPILYIHRQSSFLIGRDKKVCDIPLEHPSISKQHAALQYRAAPFQRADGTTGRRVRPYVIDLDSANGTFVNNKKIEPRRYVELLERDVVKFGFSQREYVLLHENSKDDAQDDDQDAALPVATTDKIKQEKRAKEEAAADG